MIRSLYSKLSIFAIMVLLVSTSCKNEFSNDDPFPPEYKPSIFFGNDNKIVYSYDLNTREKNWEYGVDGAVKATPVIYRNSLIVATDAGTIYKFNRLTGVLEQKRATGEPIDATPYVYNEKIIVCTRAGNVYALLGDDIQAAPIWKSTSHGPMKSSPTVKELGTTGLFGVICANTLGKVFTLDVEDGGPIWTKNLPTSGGFQSSPDATSWTIYIAGYSDSSLYSISTVDGSVMWKYKTNGRITASPISIGGNVMIGSWDREMHSVDSITGTKRWSIMTGDKIESSAFYDNQYIYFGSNDQNIYCVDVINGILTWKKRTYGVNRSSPIVFMNKVYVGSWDKNMYILRAESGAVEDMIPIGGLYDSSPIIDDISVVVYPTISGNNWHK